MSFCVIFPLREAQEGPLAQVRSNQAARESFRNEQKVGGGTRPVHWSLGAWSRCNTHKEGDVSGSDLHKKLSALLQQLHWCEALWPGGRGREL